MEKSKRGTIYKISPAGAFVTLHNFGGSDGSEPEGKLIEGTDGNFYGTTYQGGTSALGTVFKITPQGVLTSLYSFDNGSFGANGEYPNGGLVQGADGNFYGTTPYEEGYTAGIVFRITPTGTFSPFQTFNDNDAGYNPNGDLTLGSDGNLYGTTNTGGLGGMGYDGLGAVFQLTPAAAIITLHAFDGSDGADPSGGLVQGTDGNFYGTASGAGGTASGSTVFRISPTGVSTNLYAFSLTPTLLGISELVQGRDGNFYGSTAAGGASARARCSRSPRPVDSPTSTRSAAAMGLTPVD